jgi:flagellar basal body-associated protein FliL
MNPSKNNNNDEQFTGNELDETPSDEEFIGNELDEPQSNIKFSGDELDEPLSNDVDTGNELDEVKSNNKKVSAENAKLDNITEKKPLNRKSSKSPNTEAEKDDDQSAGSKKKITIVHKISAILLLLCLIVVPVYFFFLRHPKVINKPIPVKKIYTKNENQTLVYETFIVPFEHSKYYTYLLADISFDVPENKLRLEMIKKKNKIRKIIYDMLLNKIEDAQSLPPVNEIKNDIKPAVNAILENGIIKEVFITKYHAV